MKNLLWILLAILLVHSCDNEIDLYPDDVPSQYMIYGILDSEDSIQQIKIRKTFGGDDSQQSLASESESFLPSEDIVVKVIHGSGNNEQVYEFRSQEYVKDFGFFANDKNPIHVAEFQPKRGEEYRLVIDDPELPEPIIASITAIRTPVITSPFYGDAYYGFTDTLNPFYFQCQSAGQVHLLQFFVNYLEISNNNDTSYVHSSFDLRPIFRDTLSTVRYIGKAFSLSYILNIIRMQVVESDDVKLRYLHSFDFVIWAGDQTLRNFIQLAQQFPDNRKLFFSNVSGGFGFFAASSHARAENLYPTKAFFDTLMTCPVTKDLKFMDHKYIGDFVRRYR